MEPKTPVVHLVLEQGVQQQLPFQNACTKRGCPDKEKKVCPHVLSLDNKPVLDYKQFLRAFSDKNELLNPCLSHASIVGKEESGLFEYLVFFAEGCGFHEAASNLMDTTACLNPTFSA